VPATLTRPLALLGLIFALTAVLAARPAQAAGAGPQLRGVQLHSLWGGEAEMNRELELSKRAGANTVRLDIGWASLEQGGKGEYSQWYVDKLDRFMAGAHARGLKVIAGLWSTPCWASTAPESRKQGCSGSWWDRGVNMYPPANNADYGDAARWVTSRYGTKLAALEVWNEPNLPEDRFWIAPDEPAAYAGLLKAAYPAAKAGNSQVPVLAGSLAAADRPFLEQLYAHGIKGSYDGLSIHPYNESRDPSDRWQPQWKKYTFLPGIEWVQEAQRAAGDTKPLWLTELGWTSCQGGGSCVNETQQADYIGEAFKILKGMRSIKAAIVYNLREKGDSGSFEDNFGLVNRDFSAKPGYRALREALGGSKRLRLRIIRRRKAVMAVVRGPKRARVALKVTRCPKASRRRFKVRTSRRGSAKVRLGSRRQLRGCRVRAQLAGMRGAKAAAARVR